ncbi:hypothetical protein NM3164_0283 [Neisseria meningitidis NM3164]|nr:putative membrane protein [Neisseria meningitidis]EOC60826.1 hypothetical protein NM115_0310 [Neisseria meningitidis NM115]EOC60879.1 hypothetical protein NM271_0277 [Neisseria meningitidis NM271]EOC62133.1 hypothetical protein NM90_0328 [Neisseria meningitidis NM90]EOC67256.1 hypothetical protein NM3222_0298 [Neisseria meningitidis NM3222]EOC68528.1 hypothetical protein NM3131_0290 [Neisseria meningitidis NM3131]EOC72583.1 hypothetical protein NM3144_0288 [Neisseria meningitidis NM3144]E
MNKKLNYIFMLDCLGLVILFTCIIATFERDYGFKIFTNSKRPEFYYWIGMFYYGRGLGSKIIKKPDKLLI